MVKGVPYSYCRSCYNAYMRARRASGKKDQHKDRAKTAREWRLRERDKAYVHYGGKCVCCGETEFLFLTLDHVNNDGAEHRKQYRGWPTYLVARAERYPSTFQLLCYNCNCGRSRNGGVCPHVQ